MRYFPTALRRISLAISMGVLMLIPYLPIGAIGVSASERRQSAAPTTLHVAMPPVSRLDPVQVSRFDPYTHDLVENLFVGLTRFDPWTRQIEPMLAESWTVSDDGLTWTFTLRDDIHWVRYDMETQAVTVVRPVVAGDMVYAVQRACDPLRPSPVTTNLMIIRGCQTIANAFPEVINDLFIAREIGIRATGPDTLEIELMFPSGYFLTLTSTPEFRPLAREVVSNESAASTMTNGPFALRAWDDAGMTLVRNPSWTDAYRGNVEQVDVTFTTGQQSATSLIDAGQTDMARLEPSELEHARAAFPSLYHSSPGTSLVMLGFSYDRAVVSSTDARRALALAIDRSALVDQLLPGRGHIPAAFTPSHVAASPDFSGFTFNPGMAQTNFSLAGYPNCANIPEKLVLLVPDDDPLWFDIGVFITQQWSTWLGCNPNLFEVKTLSRVLMIELAHGTYDPEVVTRSHIWLAAWSADYPDANAWISDALHCTYGYIRTGRPCDEADLALDQAAVEMDASRRAALYAQAEAQFFGPEGTFPVIPLFFNGSSWLQQPWLSEVNEVGAARFDAWLIDTQAQP